MDATPQLGKGKAPSFFESFLDAVKTSGDARFTLFINTGFLQLPSKWVPPKGSKWDNKPETYQKYLAPADMGRNKAIPYAADPDEIEGRVKTILALHAKGVEMGSHTVRHDHGGQWTVEQWRAEFKDHQRILDMFGLPTPVGFRAPFLETNDAMYQVMGEYRMKYDTSRPGSGVKQPEKRPGTDMWQVGVPSVKVKGRIALLFDLNLRDNLKMSNDEFYDMAKKEFDARYHGTRAPLLLSGHGNYSQPIKRFMKEVCGKPEVRCGTFAEYADYLTSQTLAPIPAVVPGS
jgi:peptidoglycan/xylan/chitin deacetylase (PgdA/CDA1 family)